MHPLHSDENGGGGFALRVLYSKRTDDMSVMHGTREIMGLGRLRRLRRSARGAAVCVVGLLVMGGVSATVAQPDEERRVDARAVEILKRSDEATQAVTFVRYEAVVSGTGWMRDFVPNVEAKVLLGGKMFRAQQRFRIDMTIRPVGSNKVRHVTAGGFDGAFYFVDHDARTVVRGDNYDIFSVHARRFVGARMLEFLHPTPFDDELNGQRVEYVGINEVEGHPCHEIYVAYSQKAPDSRWFISTRDYLPRRVDRITTNPRTGQHGTTRLVLTNVDVTQPKDEKKEIELVVPEGYTQNPKPE